MLNALDQITAAGVFARVPRMAEGFVFAMRSGASLDHCCPKQDKVASGLAPTGQDGFALVDFCLIVFAVLICAIVLMIGTVVESKRDAIGKISIFGGWYQLSTNLGDMSLRECVKIFNPSPIVKMTDAPLKRNQYISWDAQTWSANSGLWRNEGRAVIVGLPNHPPVGEIKVYRRRGIPKFPTEMAQYRARWSGSAILPIKLNVPSRDFFRLLVEPGKYPRGGVEYKSSLDGNKGLSASLIRRLHLLPLFFGIRHISPCQNNDSDGSECAD